MSPQDPRNNHNWTQTHAGRKGTGHFGPIAVPDTTTGAFVVLLTVLLGDDGSGVQVQTENQELGSDVTNSHGEENRGIVKGDSLGDLHHDKHDDEVGNSRVDHLVVGAFFLCGVGDVEIVNCRQRVCKEYVAPIKVWLGNFTQLGFTRHTSYHVEPSGSYWEEK